MPDTRTYTPFLLSALLLVVGVVLLYPFCQYYIDPDGTAYLTISQRYADGDFARAINGYWSPLSCWLTALGIKAGLQAIPSSILVNTVGAGGMLAVSHSFFKRFRLLRNAQFILGIALSIFLCYAVYMQTFADLWECCFLLISLRIMLVSGYIERPGLWVLNGAVGALAYFAKAYAFPFFILHTICCGMYMSRGNRMQGLKTALVAIGVMAVCSMPWIYLLHDKYGIWTTSTAGKLNTSWYLVGHPYWNEHIKVLLPPAYSDSPYYWEDPYMVNGPAPQFWSSGKLFLLQIVRIAINLLKLVKSMLQLSPFFALIWLFAIVTFFMGGMRSFFHKKARVMVLSFLLFPLGFVIINYEARYIWYMLPLSMVTGMLILKRRRSSLLAIIVFAAGYVIWPLWDVTNIIGRGAEEQIAGTRLREGGMRGAFTASLPQGPYTQKLARLAYFSGNPYYMMPGKSTTPAALLDDMHRYGVKYYIEYTNEPPRFSDTTGMASFQTRWRSIKDINVFVIKP